MGGEDQFRQWMVVIRSGGTWSWDFRDGCTQQNAEQDIHGIVEAGGNMWDTPDNYLPEGDEDEGYESITIPADGMSRDAMEMLYRTIRAINPEKLEDPSLTQLWQDLRLPAEIQAL